MIDKINDVSIRETVFEETTKAKEPQAQDKCLPRGEVDQAFEWLERAWHNRALHQ